MGWWSKLFKNPNKQQVNEYQSGSISMNNTTDFAVTLQSMLKTPELYEIVNMIGNDISSISIYDGKRKIHTSGQRYVVPTQNDDWYNLLNSRPNKYQSNSEFWVNNFMNLIYRGAFYVWIEKDYRGRPISLNPVHPENIRKVQDENGDYFYQLMHFEDYQWVAKETIPYNEVVSVYYSDFENVDDLEFKTIFTILLEKLGLKHQYDLASLNTAPMVMAHIKAPQSLNDEDRKKLKDSLSSFAKKSKTSSGTSVLVTDPKVEVELLDPSKMQVKSGIDTTFDQSILREIASAFHVPLEKLNILKGTSQYKTKEAVNIDYFREAVQPWLNKIVDKFSVIAFPNDKTKIFDFNINSWIRVDYATLGVYTSHMRQNAILTTNELRLLNGYLPIDKPEHDEIVGNGTLMPITQTNKEDTEEVEDVEEPIDEK